MFNVNRALILTTLALQFVSHPASGQTCYECWTIWKPVCPQRTWTQSNDYFDSQAQAQAAIRQNPYRYPSGSVASRSNAGAPTSRPTCSGAGSGGGGSGGNGNGNGNGGNNTPTCALHSTPYYQLVYNYGVLGNYCCPSTARAYQKALQSKYPYYRFNVITQEFITYVGDSRCAAKNTVPNMTIRCNGEQVGLVPYYGTLYEWRCN